MANEKEVRSGEKEAEDPGATVCSLTGECCRCGNPGGCDSRRWSTSVDNLSTPVVRQLKVAHVRAETLKNSIDDALELAVFDREWPGPELRDIRRKASAILSTLESIFDK